MDSLNDFDIVMKSPGIAFLDVDIKDGTLVTCQTDLFLKFAPCRKVGITGSKGKTTTSTLIYDMLKEGGFDARLIGNIGVPVLEDINTVTPETIAVIEMSSHQLEFTTSSPEVAVLTNIYEEHLDHYRDGFRGYVNAKLNIVRRQKESDTFIYNATQGLDGLCDPRQNQITQGHRQDILFALEAAKHFGVDTAAYGEAKRISEKLGFAEIRYCLCLGFALGHGSCVKLRCRTGKRQVVIHDFVVAKVEIARNINAACVGIPL